MPGRIGNQFQYTGRCGHDISSGKTAEIDIADHRRTMLLGELLLHQTNRGHFRYGEDVNRNQGGAKMQFTGKGVTRSSAALLH